MQRVLQQPLQVHFGVDVLVADLGRGAALNFTTKGGVPMVFDGVIGAARQQLGNDCTDE